MEDAGEEYMTEWSIIVVGPERACVKGWEIGLKQGYCFYFILVQFQLMCLYTWLSWMCINGNSSILVNSFVAVFAWSMFFVPAASFFSFFFLFLFFFNFIPFFCLFFCYVFFCILAKLRLAMHDASASTHSRALVDKKLQISIRKARSLQDRMQHQQPPQPLPPPGGAMAQSTR